VRWWGSATGNFGADSSRQLLQEHPAMTNTQCALVPCPYPKCPSHSAARPARVVSFGAYRTKSGQRSPRWRCESCQRTFGATTGTPLARLRAPTGIYAHALQLGSEGLSKAAIARVLGSSPSTISRWIERAATHARIFHVVKTVPEEVGEIQMDELAARGSDEVRSAWVYSAIEVFTRLWVAMRVSRRTLRNTRAFVREVMDTLARSESCAIVTSDGMKYYEPSMRRVFRNYPVVYQQVDNVYRDGRVVRSNPRLVFGSQQVFEEASMRTDSKKPNTAFIERLNLVQRTCCAFLRRRTASPARRIASLQSALEIVRVVYNYVRPHASLRTQSGKQTPAMAAGLAQRPLTLLEILCWRIPSSYWRQKQLMEAATRC
jgi:transposase-like protein/IS1 family transposase